MRTAVDADDGRTVQVRTMGPICVAPEYKRQGCGKKLLDHCPEKAAALGFGAAMFEGNVGFYGGSGYDCARRFGIRCHDLPAGAVDSFFLCGELAPGCLAGVTGVYRTPKGYCVSDEDAEAFDRGFPPKRKAEAAGPYFLNRGNCLWTHRLEITDGGTRDETQRQGNSGSP